MARIKPEFYVDYHSYANLVLYPVGWQVETYGGDTPLMEALAGTDRNPSVASYDPDVGGELYTTNGEITDTMYLQHGILSYTIELDGGSGAPVGGTTTAGNAVGSNPGGFVFQDRESDVEAVFAKNLPFMLDLARSAPTPDQPVSHIGAHGAGLRADRVPDVLRQPADRRGQRAPRARRGDGQVAGRGRRRPSTGPDDGVRRRRALRPVRASTTTACAARSPASPPATRSRCGSRRAARARTRSRSRRRRTGATTACSCSPPRTTAACRPNTAPGTGPTHLATYLDALADAGIPADVYDIDASGRNHADLLGVLGHYRAVVWYTGAGRLRPRPRPDDRRLEDVRRPDGRGARLPQRGRQGARHRPARAPGRVVAVLLQPARALPGQAAVPLEHGPRRRRASSRTACRSPTTSCSTGWAPTRGPPRPRPRPR